jgi:mRNA interferase RelE/StbE
MSYKVLLTSRSRKQISKLDKGTQRTILDYLENRVTQSPHDFGKSLVGDKKGLWRYRIGDYRIICNISNSQLLVLVVEIGHRSSVYD